MMLTVISPAKKLDYSSSFSAAAHTQPALLKHSQELLEGLKKLSPQDVCEADGLERQIRCAELRALSRMAARLSMNDNARQAVLAFKGDVYQGLGAESMSEAELQWAQGPSAYFVRPLWRSPARWI